MSSTPSPCGAQQCDIAIGLAGLSLVAVDGHNASTAPSRFITAAIAPLPTTATGSGDPLEQDTAGLNRDKKRKIHKDHFWLADAHQKDNLDSQITIGIELEMVLFNIPAPFSAFEHTLRALQDLYETNWLSQQSYIWIDDSIPDRKKFIVTGDETINCSFFRPKQQQGDAKQQEQESRIMIEYVGESVEIVSPILRHGSWEWVIPTLMSHLETHLDCKFNETCGFHVHVGLGGGWGLPSLKRLSKAIMIFEVAFDEYHDYCRRPEFNFCIESNRFQEHLKYKTVLQLVRLIDKCQDEEELYFLVSPFKFFKYNLLAVTVHGTVEFRQAAAGLDYMKATDWVRRIVRFVERSLRTEDAEFEALARAKHLGLLRREVVEGFGVPWVGKVL